MSLQPDLFLLSLLVISLLISAITDLRKQKIYNIVTYPTMAIAVVDYSVTKGVEGLSFSMIGLIVGIGLMIGPYLLGGMGAGDAKLMGAVGSVLGTEGVFISFLYTGLAGGVYALVILIVERKKARRFLERMWFSVKTFMYTRQYADTTFGENEEKLPRLCYGIAIAVGTLLYIALEAAGLRILSF